MGWTLFIGCIVVAAVVVPVRGVCQDTNSPIGRVIVTFYNPENPAEIARVEREFGLNLVKTIKSAGLWVYTSSQLDPESLVIALKSDPAVSHAEVDHIVKAN
jgi:hypothetical protein